MSKNSNLDDILQACRNIQSNQSNPLHSSDNSEIDRILAKYSSDTEMDIRIEPELVKEHKEHEDLTEIEKKESIVGKYPVLKSILSVLICLFTALVLSLLISEYVAHHTSVEGSSMEKTLGNGDQIIVENISYYCHEPERFDIVVFPSKEGINYIKRIIGLPGETVQIVDGYININGQQLEEHYGNERIENPGLAKEEIHLGDSEYFVLGDNRNGSIDSRRTEIGNIKRDNIKGKAWFRFYPFSRMGTIK